MKRRKLTAILLAVAMVLALSGANVFAAAGFDDSTDQEDRTVQGNGSFTLDNTADGNDDEADENILEDSASPKGIAVPVYGILGVPDGYYVKDPDPTDGGEEPDIAAYEINVSVPVKIIWAVFESELDDNGTDTDESDDYYPVRSPEYSIKNNSAQGNNLTIEIDDFYGDSDNNSTVADDIELTFVANGTSFTGGSHSIFNTASSPTFPAVLGGQLGGGNSWGFIIGGKYTNSTMPDEAYRNPKYSLVLKFTKVV
jgi:hypothetical protein